MRSMENTVETGMPSENHRDLIDRKMSVAPMMDWVNS
jgi:hypothetical protein